MSIKSTYSDADMINSLLSGHAPADPTREFKSAKWEYVNDNNNSSYSNGNIVFNSIHLRNIWKDWMNAYSVVPISITGATTYTGAGNVNILGWKESILSFFYGVMIKINSVTVVNDTDIQHLNGIKLLLKSKEWADATGSELMYAKDTNVETDATDANKYDIIDPTSNFVAATSAGSPTKALIALTTENPTYNEGLHKRSCYIRGDYARLEAGRSTIATAAASLNFVDSSGFATAGPYSGAVPKTVSSTAPTVSSYSFDLKLPLRYLHSFFEELDFPLINDQMELTIMTTNNSTVSNYTPLMTPTGGYVPTITIRGPCRLYYRRLEFNAREQQLVNSMVSQKVSKDVHFLKSDWYQPLLANTSTSVTQLITASSINPVRVWSVMRPAGNALLSVAGQSQIAPVPTITSNLKVNGSRLFDSDLETVHDHWEQLKEQLVDYVEGTNKSQITYMDYLQFYQGYGVYDLIRNKYNVLTKNSSSELTWNCTKPATSVDIEFIVEREAQISIPLGGDGGVLVVQG